MEVTVDSPGVPAGGLRILHLSDMHFTGRDRIERLKIERTIKLLAREQMDLLLITGDLIHDTGGLPAALDLIDRLPRPRLGAFACLGNHDYSCYSWLGPARVAWREAEPGREMQAAVQRTIEMVARVLQERSALPGPGSQRRRRAEARARDSTASICWTTATNMCRQTAPICG